MSRVRGDWLRVTVFSALVAAPIAVLNLWPSARGAGSCLGRAWLGVDCPGCGLTTAVRDAFHLEITRSVAVHPLGPFAAVWALSSLIISLWLAGQGEREGPARSRALRLQTRVHQGFAIALLSCWIVRAAVS